MRAFPSLSGALLTAFCTMLLHPAISGEILNLDLGASQTLELIRVEPGTFRQGSPLEEAGRGADETQRNVTLTRPFLLGKYPITRGQFARFVAESRYRTDAESGPSGGFGWDGTQLIQRKDFTWKNPGFAQTDEHPVTLISYKDAGAFLQWLSRKSGRTFSLPTEAQWEYAARAGGAPAMDAWHRQNSGNATQPVGRKVANPWGFADMLGNVWEWCEDWYGPYPEGDVSDPLQRNSNLSDKPRRVLRGGSWMREPKFCRPAARYRNDPLSRNADNGFRVMTFDLDPRVSAPVVPAKPPVNLEATEPSPAAPAAAAHSPIHVESDPKLGRRNGRFAWLLALPIFGVLFAIVAVIVRAIVKSVSATATGSVGGAPLPSRTSEQPIRVRIGEDGFWIDGQDLSRGALISCRYTVNGNANSIQVNYEPGPQGHFVFTGSRPANVSVSSAMGGRSGSNTSRRVGEAFGMSSTLDDDPPFRGHPPAY